MSSTQNAISVIPGLRSSTASPMPSLAGSSKCSNSSGGPLISLPPRKYAARNTVPGTCVSRLASSPAKVSSPYLFHAEDLDVKLKRRLHIAYRNSNVSNPTEHDLSPAQKLFVLYHLRPLLQCFTADGNDHSLYP